MSRYIKPPGGCHLWNAFLCLGVGPVTPGSERQSIEVDAKKTGRRARNSGAALIAARSKPGRPAGCRRRVSTSHGVRPELKRAPGIERAFLQPRLRWMAFARRRAVSNGESRMVAKEGSKRPKQGRGSGESPGDAEPAGRDSNAVSAEQTQPYMQRRAPRTSGRGVGGEDVRCHGT